MKCPKCKGEMEEGLIYDKGKFQFSPINYPEWGTGFKLFRGIQNKRKVKTYRCKKCGYLESYTK